MSHSSDSSAPAVDRGEILGDTEATLRRVETAVAELADPHDNHERTGDPGPVLDHVRSVAALPGGLAGLVKTIVSASAQITAIIRALRESQEVLSEIAADRVLHTHAKLQEVTSATETAATRMLDGLDRALNLLDEMESKALSPAFSDAAEAEGTAGAGNGREGRNHADIRDDLRDELHVLITVLQFQDITSQQLGYASNVLLDMETRLGRIADTFREWGIPCDGPPPERKWDEQSRTDSDVVNDPDASCDSNDRQSVADEIFPR